MSRLLLLRFFLQGGGRRISEDLKQLRTLWVCGGCYERFEEKVSTKEEREDLEGLMCRINCPECGSSDVGYLGPLKIVLEEARGKDEREA